MNSFTIGGCTASCSLKISIQSLIAGTWCSCSNSNIAGLPDGSADPTKMVIGWSAIYQYFTASGCSEDCPACEGGWSIHFNPETCEIEESGGPLGDVICLDGEGNPTPGCGECALVEVSYEYWTPGDCDLEMPVLSYPEDLSLSNLTIISQDCLCEDSDGEDVDFENEADDYISESDVTAARDTRFRLVQPEGAQVASVKMLLNVKTYGDDGLGGWTELSNTEEEHDFLFSGRVSSEYHVALVGSGKRRTRVTPLKILQAA